MTNPARPIITKRADGQYSTVLLPNEVVETMWFGNDGTAKTISRTVVRVRDIAERHIKEYEND